MVKEYVKKSIFHPFSMLGVFFIMLALIFSAKTLYKCIRNAKEIQKREKIIAEVSKASTVTTKKRFQKNGGGVRKYIQDFDIVYQYADKKYHVSYQNFNLGEPNGYQKGDKIVVYVSTEQPTDAIVSTKLFTDTTGIKQLLLLFGLPGLLIVLIPKSWMK